MAPEVEFPPNKRKMFRVSRRIDFCYGHRLLNYQGKCRHLHGHNGKVVITVEASGLDSQGMVLDFSEIKRVVSSWIDENLDHRMLLVRDDPAVPVLQQLGEPIYLMDANPTAENIARLIFEFALSQGFPVVEVCLWETTGCCATYCPVGRLDDKIEEMSVGGQCRGQSTPSAQEEN